jgi:hypothetical protein
MVCMDGRIPWSEVYPASASRVAGRVLMVAGIVLISLV